MKYIVVLSLLSWTWPLFCQDLGAYQSEITDAYPKTRMVSGSQSLLFGGLAIKSGLKAVRQSSKLDENIAGLTLGTIGFIRFVDGGLQLFKQEPAEKRAKNGDLITKSDFKQASKEARSRRQIRTSLVGGSALMLTYLYIKDSNKYQNFIYSSIILTLVTAMQFHQESIEEKVWNDIQSSLPENDLGVSRLPAGLYLLPSDRGVELSYQFNF